MIEVLENSASGKGSLPNLQVATCSLCPLMTSPLCTNIITPEPHSHDLIQSIASQRHTSCWLIHWGSTTLDCYFKSRLDLYMFQQPSTHPAIYSFMSYVSPRLTPKMPADSATLMSRIWSLEDNSQQKWVTLEKTKDTLRLHNNSQWSAPYKEQHS